MPSSIINVLSCCTVGVGFCLSAVKTYVIVVRYSTGKEVEVMLQIICVALCSIWFITGVPVGEIFE